MEDDTVAVLQMAARPQAWKVMTHLTERKEPQPACELAAVMDTTTAAAQVLLLQMYRAGLLARSLGDSGGVGRRSFLYSVQREVESWLKKTQEMAAWTRRCP